MVSSRIFNETKQTKTKLRHGSSCKQLALGSEDYSDIGVSQPRVVEHYLDRYVGRRGHKATTEDQVVSTHLSFIPTVRHLSTY